MKVLGFSPNGSCQVTPTLINGLWQFEFGKETRLPLSVQKFPPDKDIHPDQDYALKMEQGYTFLTAGKPDETYLVFWYPASTNSCKNLSCTIRGDAEVIAGQECPVIWVKGPCEIEWTCADTPNFTWQTTYYGNDIWRTFPVNEETIKFEE